MRLEQSRKKINSLRITERLELAQEKIENMVEAILPLFTIHENNRIIVHSDRLSRQIPTSFAANAFNSLVYTSQNYEIIQLCRFWDGLDFERANLITVTELVDCRPLIFDRLDNIRKAWGTAHKPHEDPELERRFAAREVAFGKSQAFRQIVCFKRAIRRTRNLYDSDKKKALFNFRNEIAHMLKRGDLERSNPVASPLKYGDERFFLEETAKIIDIYYNVVNGVGFNWDSSRDIAKRNANSLWNKCTFNVDRFT